MFESENSAWKIQVRTELSEAKKSEHGQNGQNSFSRQNEEK